MLILGEKQLKHEDLPFEVVKGWIIVCIATRWLEEAEG